MARPTPLQRYYLFQIGLMRWFGAIFAGAAILITGSNLPWLARLGDPRLLALDVIGGAGFYLAGLVLYRLGSSLQRRYRAHIREQID